MEIKGTHLLAAMLSVNVSTVYRWLKRPDFPRQIKEGINWFDIPVVLKWVDANSSVAYKEDLIAGSKISVVECARILGITRYHVLRMIQRGLPRIITGGGHTLVDTDAAIWFLDSKFGAEGEIYAKRLQAFREKRRAQSKYGL